MAEGNGKLTALLVKSAKPGKHFDGGGLYLLVTKKDQRYWRLKYRFAGKEKLLAFGVWPEVSLSEARQRRDDARRALRDGLDPSAEKQTGRIAAREAAENSFESIAGEWLEKQKRKLAPSTYKKAKWTLEEQVFPWLGTKPISEIEAPALLSVLRRIEARGAVDTAHRTRQRCSQVFRYAIATGRAHRDPTADLRGALAPVKVTHRAAVTDPTGIGALLRDLDSYQGHFITCCALRFAPLVFVRPGELRRAEWSELDFENALWRIPAHKMKMREEHLVPLAPQAVRILRELEPLTSGGRYLFPGRRSITRPMSANTINAALRNLGYDTRTMTGHGFRAMASTRLNELGWSPDVIERQLGHAERNKVRSAYNRAQYLEERRKMMNAWADYLDGLKQGADVVAIRRNNQ